MKTVFHDKHNMECIFTDEGVTFCDSRRDIFYPYGCLDSLELSFLGIMQAVCRSQVCCFNVSHKDRAEVKKLIAFARGEMASHSSGRPVIIEKYQVHVDENLPAEEQLKQFKAMFVQGILSKEQYDLKKRLLAN